MKAFFWDRKRPAHYRQFDDPTKKEAVVKYLSHVRIRGPMNRENNSRWYDGLVRMINNRHPTMK